MELRDFLVEKHGYDPKTVHIMVRRLEALNGSFREALQKWVATGEPADAGEFCGYTVSRLMKEKKMNFPAAITTLSWIAKEGDAAVKEMNRGVK